MQKKIIALAVAGLVSGSAFAQTNVQVYGIMDLYYNFSSGDGGSDNGVGTGGLSTSRIGVKGTEDLGNGLKAYFNVESAITAGQDLTNASAFGGATRQSYIGLTNASWGAVQMGTQSSLSDAWAGQYDYAADLSAKTWLRGRGSSGIAKVANSVAYLSPKFGGATFGYAHVASETNELAAGDTDTNQVGVNYGNGPLAATYVYSTTSRNDLTNTKQSGNFLGLSYNFGVATAMFEWTNQKNDVSGGADTNNKFWQAGAVIPFGAGNIHVGHGRNSMDANNTDAKSTIIAYTHGLSKRTTAYVGVIRNSNDSAAAVAAPTVGGFVQNGGGYTNVAVGMKHTF